MTERSTGSPWRNDDRDGLRNPPVGLPAEHSRPFQSTDHVWYYHDRLRHYLILLGKNPKNTERLNNFPEGIKPPDEWNNQFLDMIQETNRTGNEWYSILGTNKYGEVLLPKKEYLVEGSNDKVSGEVILIHENWAKNNSKGVNVIGGFHTHPSKKYFKSLIRRLFDINSTFSAGDMYCLAKPKNDLVMGAIQTNKQYVVGFRSHESVSEESFDYLPVGYRDQNSFSDYWYRTVGLEYDPDNQTARPLNGKHIGHDEWIDKIWNVNMEIAKKHYIALYRGHIGFYLTRTYPAQPSIDEIMNRAR